MEVRPWARVVGDVNVRVRRGAWYEVIRLTQEAALLEVNRQTLNVPRSAVQVQTVRPREWSIVARPHDAVDIPPAGVPSTRSVHVAASGRPSGTSASR